MPTLDSWRALVGIDVGAKAEIHRLISKLASQGTAVIMISSELPEVLGMSDRVLVMHEGRLTGILNRDEADQVSVMQLAAHWGFALLDVGETLVVACNGLWAIHLS